MTPEPLLYELPDPMPWRALAAPTQPPPPADSPSGDGYYLDTTNGYYISNDGAWYWTGVSWFATADVTGP